MLKTHFLLLLTLLIFAACKEAEEPKEEVQEKEDCVLDGTFMLVNDSVSESLRNTDSLLIEELSFFEDHCTFTYDSVGYRGTYGCIAPYIWVAVEGFDTLRLEQLSEDEFYGQGFIEGRYLRKGSTLFDEALAAFNKEGEANEVKKTSTEAPTKVDTPKDDKKPLDKPTDKTTTPNTSNVGLKDAKISFGDNLSGNTYRVRLYEPYSGGIKSKDDAKIYLLLFVDAQGNVMKVENNTAKTTTDNTQLLNDIIALAKKIKYNKEPDASLAKVPLTVTVNVD